MKILNIPIEPIEDRYSAQWDKWFRNCFKSMNLDVLYIYGEKTSGKINHGSFLDVIETNVYKTSQVLKILKYLSKVNKQEKVVLFFQDLWFPGLESIAYIREGLGLKNLKICGCLHAGSYDSYDFLNKTGMTPWASKMEDGWFNHIVDQIYVATNFHKKLLQETRNISADKIIVTGFPLYPDFVKVSEKEKLVIFPHRLDSEKQPDLFDRLSDIFAGSGWRFVKTKDVIKSKKEYYILLNKAAISISFALQETWGIAMQESVLCGAAPLCPDRLSYSEMYDPSFLYDSFENLVILLQKYMKDFPKISLKNQEKDILKKGSEAISIIIQKIQSL